MTPTKAQLDKVREAMMHVIDDDTAINHVRRETMDDLKDAFKTLNEILDLDTLTARDECAWQPIETAPMDGKVFLVCLPRMMSLIIRARYNTVHKFFITDQLNENCIDKPAFFHDGDFWMPLPAPPTNEIVKEIKS